MTDKERIDDAYERIDIDTDEILAFYDGERVERCLKSVWDSTVTMHQIATVALMENAKLRELLADTLIDPRDYCAKYGIDYDGWDSANDDIDRRLRELGVEEDG